MGGGRSNVAPWVCVRMAGLHGFHEAERSAVRIANEAFPAGRGCSCRRWDLLMAYVVTVTVTVGPGTVIVTGGPNTVVVGPGTLWMTVVTVVTVLLMVVVFVCV